MFNNVLNIPVLILAGGQGRRLSSVVADVPKILALIGGRPLADIMVERLMEAGFRELIFATGHKADQIRRHFSEPLASTSVQFSHEEIPLGTGGSIWNARRFLEKGKFFVVNGDSLCDVDHSRMIDFHGEKKALCSIAISETEDRRDYGSVVLDSENRVLAFNEKGNSTQSGLINAGVYLMDPSIFRYWKGGPEFSIETDFFPEIIGTRRIYGFRTKGQVFDIGTPERYALMSTNEGIGKRSQR